MDEELVEIDDAGNVVPVKHADAPVALEPVVRPRTFTHFPEDIKCPVCKTSEDAECILLEIDGTEEENICQAQPVHLWCAVAQRYRKDIGLLYRKV